MCRQAGCTSCPTSGWRTSSHLQEWGEHLFSSRVSTVVCYQKTSELFNLFSFLTATMNSVFPACCSLEGWPGSLTGPSQSPRMCSSLVSKQVGVQARLVVEFKMSLPVWISFQGWKRIRLSSIINFRISFLLWDLTHRPHDECDMNILYNPGYVTSINKVYSAVGLKSLLPFSYHR